MWGTAGKVRANEGLQWTPTHGHTGIDQPAKTCIHQLSVDTQYSLEDLPRKMIGRDGWQESVKEICAVNLMMNAP